MSSNVRALLKAKRQEAQINHPLAAYTSAGQLRCTLCDVSVNHAAAWAGHLGSKSHRTNALRRREKEKEKEKEEKEKERHREQERTVSGMDGVSGVKTKRRREGDEREDQEEDMDVEMTGGPGGERRLSRTPAKKQRTEVNEHEPGTRLPSDFFSDPSQVPIERASSSDEESPEDDAPADEDGARRRGDKATAPATLDDEWMRFQQEVVNAPDKQEVYNQATVAADAQLISGVADGFPLELQTPQDEQQPGDSRTAEEAARRRKAEEEKELIMDRLMDEERAQEEADMRVTVMKNRLEAIRRRRAALRA